MTDQTAARRRTWGKSRRVIVLTAVVIAVLAIASAGGKGSKSSSSAAAAGRTDAQLAAIMAGNVASLDTTAQGVRKNADGTYDLSVKDGLLFVATLLPAGPEADKLCASVASMTNDPDTAKPLGITNVVVIAGSQELAHCRVPN